MTWVRPNFFLHVPKLPFCRVWQGTAVSGARTAPAYRQKAQEKGLWHNSRAPAEGGGRGRDWDRGWGFGRPSYPRSTLCQLSFCWPTSALCWPYVRLSGGPERKKGHVEGVVTYVGKIRFHDGAT